MTQDRKLRHDYLNAVQTLACFVRLASKGKLEVDSPDSAAVFEEARQALAFLMQQEMLERLTPSSRSERAK